ncbi:MAG: three component ABC system middle component [Methylococcaceae bacterium]
MLAWEDRPFEVAYNLNPAFLAILLYQAISAFEKQNKEAMPYALVFLIIPLVFYTPIREKLPKDDKQNLHDWLKKNPDISIKLHKSITQLVPYSKEAIIFAMQHQIININHQGNLSCTYQSKIDELEWTNDSRTLQMKEKAKFLGKWLANLGNATLIYRTLGIKP